MKPDEMMENTIKNGNFKKLSDVDERLLKYG